MRVKAFLFVVSIIGTSAIVMPARAQTTVQSDMFMGTNLDNFVTLGPNVICPDGSQGSACGFGFIFAADSITHTPGTPPTNTNGAFIEIDGYSDSCGTSLGFALGGLSGGYTGPNSSLQAASVSGTTTVQDLDFGTLATVVLNLAYTGQGRLFVNSGASVSHDYGGYVVTVNHDVFKSRDATVSGTFTINGAQPDLSFFTTNLVDSSSGSVIVQKN